MSRYLARQLATQAAQLLYQDQQWHEVRRWLQQQLAGGSHRTPQLASAARLTAARTINSATRSAVLIGPLVAALDSASRTVASGQGLAAGGPELPASPTFLSGAPITGRGLRFVNHAHRVFGSQLPTRPSELGSANLSLLRAVPWSTRQVINAWHDARTARLGPTPGGLVLEPTATGEPDPSTVELLTVTQYRQMLRLLEAWRRATRHLQTRQQLLLRDVDVVMAATGLTASRLFRALPGEDTYSAHEPIADEFRHDATLNVGPDSTAQWTYKPMMQTGAFIGLCPINIGQSLELTPQHADRVAASLERIRKRYDVTVAFDGRRTSLGMLYGVTSALIAEATGLFVGPRRR